MTNTRRNVLDWVEQGHIAPSDLPAALAIAEVLPSRDGWRHFLDRLLLWMGVVLIASGLIFFLAYNWNELGRYAKFSLAETMVLAALLFVWRAGLDSPGGKAALFAASLFVGALLALIGQTYQTGADTFELFGGWAAMILPWVLVCRYPALWLLWLALLNLAITLYFQTFPNFFGMLFGPERLLWILFALDTVALAVWETLALRGTEWLKRRWGPRLLATASGSLVTSLAMMQIVESHSASVWAIPAWLAWLALAFAVYRRLAKDLFVLAGGVLSVILIVATFLAKHLTHNDASGFLMIGLLVIALSATGGWWLKQLAAEDER